MQIELGKKPRKEGKKVLNEDETKAKLVTWMHLTFNMDFHFSRKNIGEPLLALKVFDQL